VLESIAPSVTGALQLLKQQGIKKHTVRYGIVIMVTTSKRLLPARDIKVISGVRKHENRAMFHALKYHETDATVIRFLSSAMGNICERCEYFILGQNSVM
jgi:hypothetical protein